MRFALAWLLFFPGSAIASSHCLPLSGDVTRLHVDAAKAPSPPFRGPVIIPDGSQQKPFWKIGEALLWAKRQNFGAVKILIEQGSYRDNLTITRATALIGSGPAFATLEGTIVNRSEHRLTIERLVLQNASSPGALVVGHPFAETCLDNVDIREAEGFGIQQHGGSLRAKNLNVFGTKSNRTISVFSRSFFRHGTAIYLSGGVRGELFGVTLLENESAGLVVNGAGSSVKADNVNVMDTGSNRVTIFSPSTGTLKDFFNGGYAAVEVGQWAHACLTRIRIRDSWAVGLHLHHYAKARVEHADVARTRSINLPTEADFGTNILVNDGATLDLQRFTSSDATAVGIYVQDAQIAASRGRVTGNSTGVGYYGQNSPLACLMNGVFYFDNVTSLVTDQDISASEDPLGDIDLPDENPPEDDDPECPSVPCSPPNLPK